MLQSYCARQNRVAQRLKMLIYRCRKLRFFALARLVLPSLATLFNSLPSIAGGSNGRRLRRARPRQSFQPLGGGAGGAVFREQPPFGPGGQGGFADQFDAILSDPSGIKRMRAASRERHGAMFTWEKVLGEHEGLLEAGSRGKVQGSS
jgi:hypothetical protein